MLLAILIAAPILVIALSIPLILGRVKRNLWYGIRTPATMSGTEENWYAINRSGGIALCIGSAASLALVIAAGFFAPLTRFEVAWLASSLPAFLLIAMAVTLLRRQPLNH